MNWLETIRWDDKGLVPVIAQEAASGDVLDVDAADVRERVVDAGDGGAGSSGRSGKRYESRERHGR